MFILETQFEKNMGGSYTYSSHKTLDLKFKPICIEVGDVRVTNYHFQEYSIIRHCASLRVNITDHKGKTQEAIFHHSNGLGLYYSDIDGEGIYSFIELVRQMRRISELGGWKNYDDLLNYKIRLGAKLYHNNSVGFSEIAYYIEENKELAYVILKNTKMRNLKVWVYHTKQEKKVYQESVVSNRP